MDAHDAATSERSWWHRSGIGPWVGKRSAAAWHAGRLVGLSLAAFGAALLTVAVIVVSFGGLLPSVSPVSRRLVRLYRTYARKWTDEELPTPYLPAPPPPLRGSDGSYRVGRVLYAERAAAIRAVRYGGVLRDSATWSRAGAMASRRHGRGKGDRRQYEANTL